MNESFELFDKAVEGDQKALGDLVAGVQDLIYNLSLRMLGTTFDAEDATQEIIVKVITGLSTFRKESAFSTWVYRIAVNYLINYKKSMFALHPLSFEFYGADIERGFIENSEDLTQGVDQELLTAELKQSCTNVMLQCLDAESRIIFVLGVMFKIDSKVCGEILDMTPEAYRQRLSRIRKKVGAFLGEYCGLSGTGKCSCQRRIGYAIQTHRLNPRNLEYSALGKTEHDTFTRAMEEMDELSLVFAQMPAYRSTDRMKSFVSELVSSHNMNIIRAEG